MESKSCTSSCSVWREAIAIHDDQIRSVALAKRRQPLKAEPHETVVVSNDQAAHQAQFDQFHEAIELLAPIVQPTANLLDPLILRIVMALTLRAQHRYLIRQVWFIACA